MSQLLSSSIFTRHPNCYKVPFIQQTFTAFARLQLHGGTRIIMKGTNGCSIEKNLNMKGQKQNLFSFSVVDGTVTRPNLVSAYLCSLVREFHTSTRSCCHGGNTFSRYTKAFIEKNHPVKRSWDGNLEEEEEEEEGGGGGGNQHSPKRPKTITSTHVSTDPSPDKSSTSSSPTSSEIVIHPSSPSLPPSSGGTTDLPSSVLSSQSSVKPTTPSSGEPLISLSLSLTLSVCACVCACTSGVWLLKL